MAYEEIRLVKPSLGLKDKALEYRQEHFDFGEQIINGSELFDKIASYEEWLKKVIANSSTETVDPNWVLTDTFFAVRMSDNKIVGIVDLRYQINYPGASTQALCSAPTSPLTALAFHSC